MPKEQRKRGRRAEKKRAKDAPEASPEPEVVDVSHNADSYDAFASPVDDASVFYGLLTEQESEYFKRADELLDLNQFGDEDERALFIDNLYKEVAGKELKIVHSQGCSRLLERLILTSTESQLKALFQAFVGHFEGMVKHRFASHCCETLLLRCREVVTREMDPDYTPEETGPEEVYASMESLFLFMLNELQPHIKELVQHRFASHTIRMLLLVLSGRPIATSQSLVQSKKKENIPQLTATFTPGEEANITAVPESFSAEVSKILATVNDQFDAEELRAMAVHQIGSPTLQIILQLEMSLSKKERKLREKSGGTLLSKLTGLAEESDEPSADAMDIDAPNADDADAASSGKNFFQNLLYDSIGSHLAESMLRHAPKRDFNALYNKFLKTRMGSLARNETAAFVVQRVLERLPQPELAEALSDIAPQVPGLVERSRVAVLRTLIECCRAKGVDMAEFVTALKTAYNVPKQELLLKMLNLTPADLDPTRDVQIKARKDPRQLHGSLLAQAMIENGGELAEMVTDSILAQPLDTLLALCRHPSASHVIQRAMGAPPPAPASPTRRKLLNMLRGQWVNLALDTVASHIVDSAWYSPMNLRQSIAEELLKNESELRESFPGRAVWRNWGMDKFKTARRMWFALGGADGLPEKKKKTAIELARERHAKAKEEGAGTGANGVLGKRGPPGGRDYNKGPKKNRTAETEA